MKCVPLEKRVRVFYNAHYQVYPVIFSAGMNYLSRGTRPLHWLSTTEKKEGSLWIPSMNCYIRRSKTTSIALYFSNPERYQGCFHLAIACVLQVWQASHATYRRRKRSTGGACSFGRATVM